MKLMAVKFTRPYTVGTMFNKGEVAGFDPAVAEGLIKAGHAVAADGRKKALEKKEVDDKKPPQPGTGGAAQ